MKKLNNFRNFWCNALVCFLLMSFGQLRAQLAINGVEAENQVHFANNTNFEIGTLTIKIKLPPAKNTAEVTVTLPTGIEYVTGSVSGGANATSVTYVASSPVTAPVFTLVGTPSTEVAFTLKRKLTKAATDALAGRNLTDEVKVTVVGETEEKEKSNQYRVMPPVVTVQDVARVDGATLGENTATFGIRNTGVGYAHTIYFSVDYPAGITSVRFTPPTGVTLAQVGTVPAGFHNAGKTLYSLTKPGGFANNELVTITETYKVASSLCAKQVKASYVPYWGFSATELFDQNTKVGRDINVKEYKIPVVKQTMDWSKRYFEYGAGLTAAAGQKLGTFYTVFKNQSTDGSIAYDNRVERLEQNRKHFTPDNFYIIATDGTKIPVPTRIFDGNNTTFDFHDLPALAEAALAGKDIGLTDEDGDGYRDDLKPGAEVRLCFDLIATGIPMDCGNFTIFPTFNYWYESACGLTGKTRESALTYARNFGFENKTTFPVQLLKNAPEKGYLAPAMTTVTAYERYQNDLNARTNDLRYNYHMQLPSGIALKNVVFHYTDDFTDASAPTVTIPDVPAGGLLDFTTPETPPAGITGSNVRLWGHISFDMELTDCTGLGNAMAIPYTISLMNRNPDGTFFQKPLICKTANIALGCTVPCTVKWS